MQTLDAPEIKDLIDAALAFWQVCNESKLKALSEPESYPGSVLLAEKLEAVTFDHFFTNPGFKQKLFVTGDAEYFDVYKDESVQIMAMFMPPKTFYPIHDHPEMLVYSKLLKGQAAFQSYDIVDRHSFYSRLPAEHFAQLLAQRCRVRILKENDVDVVLPQKGNLHSIEALHRSVILDVMFNFYDDVTRPCSFFKLGQDKGDDLFELFYLKDEI